MTYRLRHRIIFLHLALLPALTCASDWVWVEGEAAVRREVTANSWYEAVPAGAFSEEGFIAHMNDVKPGTADYLIDVDSAGEYALWLRANPRATRISCQLNGGPWQALVPIQGRQEFPLAGWDLRFLAWIQTGSIPNCSFSPLAWMR